MLGSLVASGVCWHPSSVRITVDAMGCDPATTVLHHVGAVATWLGELRCYRCSSELVRSAVATGLTAAVHGAERTLGLRAADPARPTHPPSRCRGSSG